MSSTLASKPTDIYTRALNAYQHGDFPGACAWLEEFAAVSPAHAEARHLLAVLLAKDRRFTEAEAHFLAAIQNAPDRHDFRCNYALSLLERGDSEQAVVFFKEVLTLQPDFVSALNGLGSALNKLGDLAGAERAFRQALQFQPGNAQHHNNLGNILNEMGLPEKAIPFYRQAISLHPGYAEANFNLGITLKELDRHEEARVCFERALQLKPDYRQAAEQLEQVADFWHGQLVGRRLVLRPYSEQDASFLHHCFRNADFMANYNQFLSTGEPLGKLAAALRKSAQSMPWRRRAVDWVICLKGEAEQPIGLANLVDLDLHHRRAELLIGIPAGQAGHAGIVVEATLLVLEFAFNRARLNKLTSLVYEGNAQAQRITLKGGFTQEGFRPKHLHVAGKGYVGVYENGQDIADFRANKRLAKLSQRWLGRNVTEEAHE